MIDSTVRTMTIDHHLDVPEYLDHLREWRKEWQTLNERFLQRIDELDENSVYSESISAQIAGARAQLDASRVKIPFRYKAGLAQEQGELRALRDHLVEQFARLSKEDRLLWLDVFHFILTPELQALNRKLQAIRDDNMGQLNVLLGGLPRNGKSMYLDWYTAVNWPEVEQEINRVPVVKIQAPVTNFTPRSLLWRLILSCGRGNLEGNEERLINRLCLYFQKCRVALVILDEIEHVVRVELRRRILEISNMMPWLTFVCASCNPQHWTGGDEEVDGRWDDRVRLDAYQGDKLLDLLTFFELLLPFTSDSALNVYTIETGKKSSEKVPGLAKVIEDRTGGIMRKIVRQITLASRRAILDGEPNLSPTLLAEVWKDIRNED